jgi:CBS domain-containing protein
MNAIPLTVRDYMATKVITVSPEEEIAQVVRLLIDEDVSGVVVADNEGRVVGVVTERDCIAVAISTGYYEEWGGPVQRFMSAPVECVAPGDSLVDIAARMTESRFRRFPVVEEGRLVGLLTRRDVLRALQKGSWFKT